MKIPCSNCNQRLEIPEELAGQTIECPSCNASLAVPTQPAQPTTPSARVDAQSVPTKPLRNNELGTFSIKDVLGESWTALKENFWLSIGVYLVAVLLIGASGCLVVGPIIVAGPLMGGVFIYSLKLLRHEPVEFGDIFAGFNNFGNLLLIYFLFILFMVLSTLPGLAILFILPLVLAWLGAGPEIVMIVAGLGMVLVYLLPFYFSIRYSFSILLVADGRAKGGGSLKMSSVGARQNLGRIILFMIVALLINVIASLPFGLGLLVTAPWMGLAWAKIYEDIYS